MSARPSYDPRRPLPTRPQAAVSSASIIALSATLGILALIMLLLYWQRESMIVVDIQEKITNATGESIVWVLESHLGRLLFPSANIESIKRRFGIDESSKLPFSWMASAAPPQTGAMADQRASRSEDEIELMADERVGVDGIDVSNPDLLYGDSFDVFPVTNWQTVQNAKLKRSAEPCLWCMEVLEGDDAWCRLDRDRLRVGDTIYEIFNEAEDPKTVLSNFPLPFQEVCVVEFTIENLLDHQRVSLGISPKPIPLGEWAGHFPYSLGIFNDGSIYAGDWRSKLGTMLGGFASGDVITIIVKRKYSGAKLNGAAVLLRNGDLCGNAFPLLMESLRIPLDDNKEPKIGKEDCERMVFGYRTLKGTDYEVSSPVPMRPPRPTRAEWGYLPAPYIAISVAGAEATSPVKVVVNFGADPFTYARESVSKVTGILGLDGTMVGSMGSTLGFGNNLLVDEMERYVQLRTAKVLRIRARGDEPPSSPQEANQSSPTVVPEPTLPGACENLPSAVKGVSFEDSPSPRYIDLSDRCRFVSLTNGPPCDCVWFTLGAAHGICGRCGHDRLWHRPGPGEKRILLSEPATSRPTSPQRQSTPGADEASPLDERWLALDGRMGDWRHAMVVDDEVWYNVKTREVTSHRPELYRHRELRRIVGTTVAQGQGHVRNGGEEDVVGDVEATDEAEGKLDTFRGPVVDARRPRRRHVVRLGITKTRHRIGNDPLKLRFNRMKI